MKRFSIGLTSAAALALFALGSSSQPPPAGKKDGPPPPRFQLGDLFPPRMTEDLKLTKEQLKQIAELQADVKRKLEKILTAEQMQQIARPRRPEDDDHGRPVAQIAKELGVTPEQFREAFKKVQPAGAGQEPTQQQRQRNRKVLSEALGVSPERLDEVMDKYRPGGKGTNGPR
jgi:hypothetical protein